MCRKFKGQILIKVHCTCSSVWPLPNRLQCLHLTLIPLTCDYQWPHGERCSKNTWPSILAASSPNMNLSANMASEAISEHLIYIGGAWPQTPLACACLHTYHHQRLPNFKYLLLPLWVIYQRLYARWTLLFKIFLESYYFPPKYFYTHVLFIALCKAIYVFIPPAICTHQTLNSFSHSCPHYSWLECFVQLCS